MYVYHILSTNSLHIFFLVVKKWITHPGTRNKDMELIYISYS